MDSDTPKNSLNLQQELYNLYLLTMCRLYNARREEMQRGDNIVDPAVSGMLQIAADLLIEYSNQFGPMSAVVGHNHSTSSVVQFPKPHPVP